MSPFLLENRKMALTAIANALGKTIYRKAGRFISEKTYNREIQRAAGVVTRARSVFSSDNNQRRGGTIQQIADRLNNVFGPPIGGGNWVSRVRTSTEKFEDILADGNQLG